MSGKKHDFPKRGEIYWVNLDPTVGGETKKRRPALVVSNDIGNEISSVIIVAPITSKVKNVYPFEVKISINLETAVGDGKLTQSFDSESLERGDPFTNRECASPRSSDSESKPCITLPSRTAVSRINGKLGKIMLNQCRAIDKSRLNEKIDVIEQKVMNSVEDALKIVFGLS